MRPTDFCFSSLVLRAPSPRGLPTRHGAFAPSSYGEHGVSRHRDSLRRVRRLFLRRGRSLPHGESTRPSLWPPCRFPGTLAALSHAPALSRKP